VRIGTSVLRLVHDPDVGPIEGMFASGFRYLTVQVRDVRKEHAHLLDAGWTEGRPPVKLGETAFISFVRDPGGSWIEVSQRASLTGPLPDDA
jgi:lactoylglutathione lyase